MNIVESIKPDPKADKPNGTSDRRRKVTQQAQPQHSASRPTFINLTKKNK